MRYDLPRTLFILCLACWAFACSDDDTAGSDTVRDAGTTADSGIEDTNPADAVGDVAQDVVDEDANPNDASDPGPTACGAEPDCAAPRVCQLDRTGATVELTCAAPNGGGSLGDACAQDADCAATLCIGAQCSAPCQRSTDCAGGDDFQCEPTEIALGNNATITQNVCRPRPPASCVADSECTAPKRCIATRTTREIQFACGTPDPGGEKGAPCSNDSECAQNLCIDARCAAPCASQGDCGADSVARCELTEVELAIDTDTIEICVDRRSCSQNDECLVSEVCELTRAVGGVEGVCGAGNFGGGALGDRCTDDVNCRSNLCYDGRFGPFCSDLCVDDTDCPSAGFECATTTLDDATGVASQARTCVPVDPPPCSSQDDCASGLTCAFIENATADALITACIPSAGRLSTGATCSADSDCENRLCLSDRCAAPCEQNAQCGLDQLCQNQTVSRAGQSADFDVCKTVAQERCDITGTCSDVVRLCSDLRVDPNINATVAFCRFPRSGGSPLGTSCTSGADCRSGLCLTNFSGECSVACASDSQCAPGQVCTGQSSAASANLCVRGCSDNDDCLALANANTNYNCQINEDSRANEIDQICRPEVIVDPANPAAGALGAPCATNVDCQSGMCLTNTTYSSNPCATAADCAAGQVCEVSPSSGATVCSSVTSACTVVCDDPSDCSGGVTGNTLTSCNSAIRVTLQNNSIDTFSACARP